jgi:hypothetical protein
MVRTSPAALIGALACPVAAAWSASQHALPPTSKQFPPTTRLRSTSGSSIDTELLEKIRSGVAEAGGLEAWEASSQALTSKLGGALSDAQEAELLLASAFSWKSWATCTSDLTRKYIQTEIPNPDQVSEALQWLMEDGPLTLSKDEALLAIQEFPKEYLTTPSESYRKSQNVAPRSYRTDEAAFVSLVRQKPAAIQFTYNCEDEGCQSNCGSCWVTNGSS